MSGGDPAAVLRDMARDPARRLAERRALWAGAKALEQAAVSADAARVALETAALVPAPDGADIAALADAVRHLALVLAAHHPAGSVHAAVMEGVMETAAGIARRRKGDAP